MFQLQQFSDIMNDNDRTLLLHNEKDSFTSDTLSTIK